MDKFEAAAAAYVVEPHGDDNCSDDSIKTRVELFTRQQDMAQHWAGAVANARYYLAQAYLAGAREFRAVGWREGIEAAARECDRIAGNDKDFDSRYVRKAAGAIGLALRALLSDGKGPGEA